jgi:hypothetical protein
MQPEGSLPPSQEPSTGPCPEPDRTNIYILGLNQQIFLDPFSNYHKWQHQNAYFS